MEIELKQAIEHWKQNGHVGLDLRDTTLGGMLALLYEAFEIASTNGIPLIKILANSPNLLLDHLRAEFQLDPRVATPLYPSDIRGVSMLRPHSTRRYILWRTSLLTSISRKIWSPQVHASVKEFLEASRSEDKSHKHQAFLSFRFPGTMPSPGDYSSSTWNPLIESLLRHTSLILLGTNIPAEFSTQEGVFVLANELNLPEQICLASESKIPLVGDANGFFATRIWSVNPYLCFKDERYDKEEMAMEHDGKESLKIGVAGQQTIIGKPSIGRIERFLDRYSNC